MTKMKSIIKPILLAALISGFLAGCANDDNYDKVTAECFTATPTKSVQDIYDKANLPAVSDPLNPSAVLNPKLYTEDDIIEAYVTSSDAGGTFYKSISFQTLDGSKAFSVPVDLYNIYTEFEPGRKVYVNLKNRRYNITYGSLIIGDLYTVVDSTVTPATTTYSVGRLVPEEFRRTVKASCESVNEDQLVQHLTITQALNDNNINKLIEFDNVQFSRAAQGKTYFDVDNQIGGATNHLLTDTSGKTIIFRTSEFAKFASKTVASGSGKVRGVLTKFNSDYQFLARTEDDIKLTNPSNFIPTQLGGSSIAYSGNFTETFESYNANDRILPKYLNDAYIGSRYWEVRTFSSNKYIQMSANNTNETNTVLFYVPVDLTAANTLSFKTKDGFNNGEVLKVYYILNYTPGTELNRANLVDITSQFTIASGTASGYAVNFTNSGVYNIPASVTGNGFFVFEYAGKSGSLTTTMQIDDITVN